MSRNIYGSPMGGGAGGGGGPQPPAAPPLLPYLPEEWLWAAQPGARDNLDPLDFIDLGGDAAATASVGPSGELVVEIAGTTEETGGIGSSLVAGLSWTFPGGPIAEGNRLSIVVQLDGADPQLAGPSLYICAGPADYTAQIGAQIFTPIFGQGGQMGGFVGDAGQWSQDGDLPQTHEMKTVSHSLPLLITLEALPGGETAVGLAPAYGQPLTGVHDGSAGAFEGAEEIRFYSYIESESWQPEITLHPATFRILGIKLDRA